MCKSAARASPGYVPAKNIRRWASTPVPPCLLSNAGHTKVTGRGLLYSGVWDTLAKTVAAEGLRGLYKGWLPNWARIA